MYYPVNFDLRGKRCLVVGGGKVALRKARGLLRAGARLTVIAPRAEEGLKSLGRKKLGRKRAGWGRDVCLVQGRFQTKYLKGFSLVIVATDDHGLNSKIGARCREKGLFVNVVDQPKNCNFTVPSLFRRGPLTIAISTNGASPALSKRIRKDLKEIYGKAFGAFLRLMAKFRQEAIKKIPEPDVRRRRFEEAIASDALSLLREGKAAKASQCIQEILFRERKMRGNHS